MHRKNWDDACRFISAYQFGQLWVCRYRWKLHSFSDHWSGLGVTLECILTRYCQWNNTSVASAAPCFLHSGESHLSICSCLTVPQKSLLHLWSRQDWTKYCNATFAGVADEQIMRIQKIQNNAAWLILKKLKCDHVTPLLKELHWLPVKYCIQYKLAMLVFRHFDSTLPPYLSSSLCTYQPSSSLRSFTERLLKIPKTNLKTFSERSFGYIALTVWNSLLADLRASPSLPAFKANLKTYLFRQAFWLICTC